MCGWRREALWAVAGCGYDGHVGGWYLTSDPIGLNGGINTYAYALGSPLTYIDRFGLESDLLAGMPAIGQAQLTKVELAVARGEAFDRLEALPNYDTKESGFLFYVDQNTGQLHMSTLINGKNTSLMTSLLLEDGKYKIPLYKYCIDENEVYLVEIVHNHPESGARRFSGGEYGDIWFSEYFDINVSVTYDKDRYLYEPNGKPNLNKPNTIKERGGISLN